VLLNGSDAIKMSDDDKTARGKMACLISQLIISNSSKKESAAKSVRQIKKRETPLPLYIGLKVHNQDRGKESVMALHQLGIQGCSST
jgi:hypothetical protein